MANCPSTTSCEYKTEFFFAPAFLYKSALIIS